MGIFDKIGDAQVGYDSNWPRVGTYRANIGAVKLTRKWTGDQFLAIEMTIAEVLQAVDENPHRVGEQVTHLLKVTSPGFLGNVKQFISAALGCSPDEVDKAAADRVTSDEQPLAGVPVDWTARMTKTKAGADFTRVTYRYVDPSANSSEAAAA